jgi:hypothetical protein
MKKNITELLKGEVLPEGKFELLIKGFFDKVNGFVPSNIELTDSFANFYVASEVYDLEDVKGFVQGTLKDLGYSEFSGREIEKDKKYLIVGKGKDFVGVIIKNEGRYSPVLSEKMIKHTIEFRNI